MTDPKPITAWAIVGPVRKWWRWIAPYWIARTKIGAIRACGAEWTWRIWRKNGYTCERVVVRLAPKRKAR